MCLEVCFFHALSGLYSVIAPTVGLGDWHLCISSAWSLAVVPEEGIGSDVCRSASSGWRQPDPCCYESHKTEGFPSPEPGELSPCTRCSPEIVHDSAYWVGSTAGLSPIALVTASRVDGRGLPFGKDSRVRCLQPWQSWRCLSARWRRANGRMRGSSSSSKAALRYSAALGLCGRSS